MLGLMEWLFVLAGCVYLVTEAVIFAPFRVRFAGSSDFRTTLIYCRSCAGFWIGLLLAPLWPEWEQATGFGAFGAALASGAAAMAVGFAMNAVKPNLAYEAEQPLREHQHNDSTSQIEKEPRDGQG